MTEREGKTPAVYQMLAHWDELANPHLAASNGGEGPSVVIEWPLCYNVLAYRGICESWVFMAETNEPGADGSCAPAAW